MSHNLENKNFDDYLKTRLKESSLQPPDDIWKAIDDKLPRKLPLFLRFRYPIAATVVAFTLISSFLIYDKYSEAYQNQKKFQKQSILNNPNHSNTLQYSEIDNNHSSTSLHRIDTKENSSSNHQRQQIIDNHQDKSLSLASNLSDKKRNHSKKNKASNSILSKKSSSIQSVKKRVKTPIQKEIISHSETSIDNPILENSPTAYSEQNFSISEKNIEEQIALEALPTSLYLDDEKEIHSQFKKASLKRQKHSQYNRKGIFIAPVLGGHFTAMTKSSREGVNTHQMEQSASFGKSYGLNIGYIINSRWSIGIEWLYNSDEGQHFSEVKNGQTLDKYLLLDYMKFPVYAKYSHKILSRYDKIPIAMSYIGGIHFSKLKTVNTYINGEIAPFEVNYNSSQWGLLSGIEFDFLVSKNISFTLGSRFSFNADLQQFPRLRGADKVSPFSIQSGLYAKFNYLLPHKKDVELALVNQY